MYSATKTQTSWYESFLNILNCRESCGKCKFNKIPRQGDITLGDFWGLSALGGENDGKGVSVVTTNNHKGERLFRDIQAELIRMEQTTLEIAAVKNWNLIGSSKPHKYRKRFFKLLNQYNDYNKITSYAINRKFDVGLVGWWYGKNYGSILTNYALEEYIESLGYSVLMLDWPMRSKPFAALENTFPRRFGNKHYEIAMRRTYEEYYDLNYHCDSFVVGSDQLWNYWSTEKNGSFFFLDFVKDSRKKIAYATSFGHPIYGAPKNVLEETAFHMNRFDYVSVRERDGVEICRRTFGVEAVCNVDPVFLCDRETYVQLTKESQVIHREKYIFAYILSPSKEKRELLLKISEDMQLPLKLVLDANPIVWDENKRIIDLPDKLLENLELEDWLSYIHNAEMVLTDSYHGVCFSIIFRKKFVCYANLERGLSRFLTTLDMAGLMERMIYEPKEIFDRQLLKQNIDYESVWLHLEPEIKRSKEWLKNVLEAEKPCRASTYDLLLQRIKKLENTVTLLQEKTKNELV